MKKYEIQVLITSTFCTTHEIEAESQEEAELLAQDIRDNYLFDAADLIDNAQAEIDSITKIEA